MKGLAKTLDSFIEESEFKYGKNVFSYGQVNYINLVTPVDLVCIKHKKTFSQTPKEHFRAKENCCPKCKEEALNTKNQLETILFKEESIIKHGDKYDYSLVKFVSKTEKVEIICKKHGKFFQTPKSHLKGHGCKKCSAEFSKESKTKGQKRKVNTIESLKEEFFFIHGNTYDYSLFKSFKSTKDKIDIICKEHGPFKQNIADHKRGSICPKCSTATKASNLKSSIQELVIKFNLIHKNRFDYSLIKQYNNNRERLPILCHEEGHGLFYQRATNHLSGQICPKCANLEKSKNALLSKKELLKRFKKAYPNDLFDYTHFIEHCNYQGIEKLITIKCNKPGHVEFEVTPYAHLKGQGCPKCASTKGELKIQNFLERENIDFIKEKKFDTLMKNTYLRFDFYIEKYNLLIEYDGQQHFSPVKFGGITEEKATQLFHKAQERDIIKNKFVAKNNINLLRIPYWDFNNIEDILIDYLAKIK